MDCFERHELEVAALYRGIEGFGIGRRIHTERFPDISTDLPLVAEAIDTRERIEGVLGEIDSIVDRGLVTLEHSHLAVGEDVRAADFPVGVGSAARLTIYCGRGERTGGVASYRAVVDLLRRHGARGATVLLGVDGMHGGARRRAGLFSRNVDVPMATIAVGAPDVLQKVLSELPGVLRRPIANLERIAVVKHDGELLEPLPMVTDLDDEPPVWMALRVYTRASAHVRRWGDLQHPDPPTAASGWRGRHDAARRVGVLRRRAAVRRPHRDAGQPPAHVHGVRRPSAQDRRALAAGGRDHLAARRRHRRARAGLPRASRSTAERALTPEP